MMQGPSSQTPPVVRKNNECFNYGQLGHMAKDCQAPRVHRQKHIVCYNCRKSGYISKDCRSPRGGTYGHPVQGQTRLNAIIPEESGFNEEE